MHLKACTTAIWSKAVKNCSLVMVFIVVAISVFGMLISTMTV